MPQLEFGPHRLHFEAFGDRSTPLIALHGYGESGRFFYPLAPVIEPHFRLIVPDLPFHGRSLWQENSYRLSDLAAIVQQWAGPAPAPLALAGHSFGARIALCLLPFFAPRLQRVLLINPDGFRTRWLPLLAKLPPPLRERLLRWTDPPEKLLQWARHLHRLKLIDAFALQFLQYHLSGQERRQRLSGTWRSLPDLQPDLQAVRRAIERHDLTVDLLFGRHDDLVSEKTARRALQGLPGVHFHHIDDGHRPDPEQVAEWLGGLDLGSLLPSTKR